MVKIKESSFLLKDGSIDLKAWLNHLSQQTLYKDSPTIRNACVLSQLAGQDKATQTGESCLQQGLAIAEILADMKLDVETIAAAIVYESVQYAELSIEDVEEQLGKGVAKLVDGVERMSSIDYYRKTERQTRNQLDNLRKMLIAMVDDVRVVLIKLAERLRVLRVISTRSDTYRKQIARDTMDIYAPLANRLGAWQLKWEIEDLSFRYLENDTYKKIAKGLKARRVDRDKYVDMIVSTLESQLSSANIKNFEIYGRSKHIYSIYRKMQRKNVTLEQIYDATAVRVLVENDEDCYETLSIAHKLWQNVPEEFDDYINTPKSNGYRSLHTAVIGPEDRLFEVQIRTHLMHEEAELGVAAHWAYKEGSATKLRSHERKIAWLREVMQWQKELTEEDGQHEVEQEFLDDRIYVFTPNGDILDLVSGATPLDFAYSVHTEVGHRCRGAMVNNSIVPLTHELSTGDQIDILTTKQGRPSRDWMNPDAGYLKTTRARAKVLHWFKLQDYEQNLEDGKDMLQREFKRLNIPQSDAQKLMTSLNYSKIDDMYAALGRGDLRKTQILSKLVPEKQKKPRPKSKNTAPSTVNIEGIGNLLTSFAKCCSPIAGDDIIGYITLGRGITIHKRDCLNILSASTEKQKRFLSVTWGEKVSRDYSVDIQITAYNRQGLLNEITSIIAKQEAYLHGVNSSFDNDDNVTTINLGIKVENIKALALLLEKFNQIENVIDVQRKH